MKLIQYLQGSQLMLTRGISQLAHPRRQLGSVSCIYNSEVSRSILVNGKSTWFLVHCMNGERRTVNGKFQGSVAMHN